MTQFYPSDFEGESKKLAAWKYKNWYTLRYYMEREIESVEKKYGVEVPMKKDILSMFNQFCNRFHFLKGVKYFPSYRYALHRLLQELDLHEFAETYVPITKNKRKLQLYAQYYDAMTRGKSFDIVPT